MDMSSPKVKFEHYELSPADSVADSFVSTPGNNFPLFPPTTMNPQEVMTPQSFEDDDFEHSVSGTPQPTTSSSEKKPVKKRKSWGQQLPEPKTNLPPRKRAKTEDEKEQRRVERVLRNRRAAQSSRERKRQEVEALEAEKQEIERRNKDLQLRLQDMEQKYHELQQRMESMSNGASPAFNGAPIPSRTELPRANSPLEGTLAPELSEFRDIEHLSTPTKTINLASISPSPEMRPIDFSNASSSDMTQHPAVSVSGARALETPVDNGSFTGFSTGPQPLHHHDLSLFLEYPRAFDSHNDFAANGQCPTTDFFNSEFDHLDSHNYGATDAQLDFDDYLNDYTTSQPSSAPEIQSENPLAEKTASLQPPFGASTHGCDVGSNAVSV